MDANIDAVILDSLPDGIYCVDENLRILRWNKAAEKMTGYNIRNLEGSTCRGNLLCHVDQGASALCSSQCPLQATLADGQERSASVFVRDRDAKRIPVIARTLPIYSDKKIVAALAILSPYAAATGEKDAENVLDSLTQIALTDRLTGLYNRRYLEGELGVRISRRKDEGKKSALAFFDLDDFSVFNNRYGHDAGDEVLRKVAQAVTASFRKTDVFCRWGGEEFVCLHDFSEPGDLDEIGRKIGAAIANIALDEKGETLRVTASTGVTEILAEDAVDSAIRRADELMYRSKTNGKGRYSVG
jgi:diguanylate cyclase (GGDEF)-like protein/PAS domain S-box-containing protein